MKFSRPACAIMYDLLSPRCAMLVVSSDEVAVYAAEIVTVRKAMMRIAIRSEVLEARLRDHVRLALAALRHVGRQLGRGGGVRRRDRDREEGDDEDRHQI